MESIFHKAAQDKGYRVYNAVGPTNRMLAGWHWIKDGERRGSPHHYEGALKAFMGCCISRNIDVTPFLDDFTRHYLIAAMWTEEESIGVCTLHSFHFDTLHAAWLDCQKFQIENADDLAVAYEEYTESGAAAHPDTGSPGACAGHDFWLSRNGHGTGFWDRGLTVGEALHTAARAMGEVYLYKERGKVRHG